MENLNFGFSLGGVNDLASEQSRKLYEMAACQRVVVQSKIDTLSQRDPEQGYNVYVAVRHPSAVTSQPSRFDRYG